MGWGPQGVADMGWCSPEAQDGSGGVSSYGMGGGQMDGTGGWEYGGEVGWQEVEEEQEVMRECWVLWVSVCFRARVLRCLARRFARASASTSQCDRVLLRAFIRALGVAVHARRLCVQLSAQLCVM